MKIINFIFFLVLIIAFFSCKNELKINAPYKEIPSIYAVLNPQETIQIIRVNKVFLGDGDANQMAKISDSINYQPGDLTISLKHSVNTNDIMFRDSMIIASEGAFNVNQRVYVCSQKLATSGIYTLTVKNNKTGNVFTAKSLALDSINPMNNGSLTPPYYPYNPNEDPLKYIDYSEQTKLFKINVECNKEKGKIFQVAMRFHFFEYFSSGNVSNFVDYSFTNKDLTNLTTIGAFSFLVSEFRGSDLFGALGIALSKKNLNLNYPRKLYKIQYFVYSATQEYSDYLKISAPSLNIAQSNNLYSNFDDNYGPFSGKGAIGIFTFRSRCSVSKGVANDFITQFQRNSFTCNYRFYNADQTRQGCP